MDNLTIYKCEQGSAEWHELRLGRITGSRYNDVMMSKKTKGYQGVICEAAAEIVLRESQESFSTFDMERGIDLEPHARELMIDTFQELYEEVGFVTNDKYNPEYVGFSPDGVNFDLLKGWENKAPKIHNHIIYLKKNELPKEYFWQCHGLMLICDLNSVTFQSYYPNLKPFYYVVERDQGLLDQLSERLDEAVEDIKETVQLLTN